MLGELSVKVQDELEPELKKFLEEVISKTERVSTDKISFEEAEDDSVYNVFGNKAKYRIYDVNHAVYKENALRYNIDIYYPENINSTEWTEQDRKELFFTVSFNKNNIKYTIVVNSADSKNFANYEVVVYALPNNSEYPLHSKIAYYILAALTEREEYKFIDGLMERAKNLVRYYTKFKNSVTDHKREFLSIISDVVNTGNK